MAEERGKTPACGSAADCTDLLFDNELQGHFAVVHIYVNTSRRSSILFGKRIIGDSCIWAQFPAQLFSE